MRSALLLFLVMTVGIARIQAAITVSLKTPQGEAIADGVAILIPLDRPLTDSPPPASLSEVVQEKQEFTTYVTVVQAGSRVVFPNHDAVQHHVYSLSKANKFEFPLYDPGQAESVVFDVSGMVTLGCNIHDWMVAYVIVVPTPFFGKTDPSGRTAITAPSGRYRLEILHPRLSKAVVEDVVVPSSGQMEKTVTLLLKPERKIRRSIDGKAGGYR